MGKKSLLSNLSEYKGKIGKVKVAAKRGIGMVDSSFKSYSGKQLGQGLHVAAKKAEVRVDLPKLERESKKPLR